MKNKSSIEPHHVLLTVALLLFAFLFCVLAWHSLRMFFARMSLDYFYPWNSLVLKAENAAARESLAFGKSRRQLAAMVEHLQNENDRLAARSAADSILKQENIQLRKLLNLPLPPDRVPVYAQVMLRDPMTWNESFIIDKGEDHGIRVGDPAVVSADGIACAVLAGRVLSVTKHTATVGTLFHPECTLSVMLTESGQYGFLTGAGGHALPVISSLPVSAKYGVGEIVMTGGLSVQTPPGIYIGTLAARADGNASTVKNHLFAEAELKAVADPANLRFVTVLVSQEGR